MSEEPTKVPVLLDTDVGSDIDDAACLVYLLAQPRCELLGITTVTGEPDKRAMLADAICKAAGRSDVPIHAGAATPLLIEQAQKVAHQAEVLSRWPHRRDFEPNTAVEFLRAVIRSRASQITLLTIGPLTNVGLLFALDPQIPSLLKQLVCMCGVYAIGLHGERPREWNAMGDPHATAIVFRAGAPNHLAIGLDVTMKCAMPADDCRKRFRGGPLDVVADMAEVWFRRQPRITFHDPLAAAVIFEPDLCEYSPGLVQVELTSPRLAGLTQFDPTAEVKPTRVASEVNPARFFDHYFSVLSG